jgi:hypothetical protein
LIDGLRGSQVSAQAQEPLSGGVLETAQPVVTQALRREVNEESIHVGGGGALPEQTILKVLCECVHPHCRGDVLLTWGEYETVRRFPNRFLVKAGHEVATDERVVDDFDGHVIVEKVGSSGLYAAAADPRRRRRGDLG